MKSKFLLIVLLTVSMNCFAQNEDDNVPVKDKQSQRKKEMEILKNLKTGYTTKLGWSIKPGDTLQLGFGSGGRQLFSYAYSSPASFNQMFDTKNVTPIKYLSNDYNNLKAIVKKFGRKGNNKVGYFTYVVVGIGEMENYWIEIENAIEFGELIPPNPEHAPKYEPLEVKVIGAAPTPDKYDQLAKLKKLFDDGILSQEEYDQEKSKLLNQ